MKHKRHTTFPLDHSAVIHLAARRKNYTNEFRIAITLKEPIDAAILQKAVNRITPRFPTVIAGIRRGMFQYHIVPSKIPPQVKEEAACLVPMTKDEIKTCAFRVLYKENTIVTEIFHALTDGYGGMVVINTLVAEYLRLKYAVVIPVTELVLQTDSTVRKEELIDDYDTYAGKKPKMPKHSNVYQLPGEAAPVYRVIPTGKRYPAKIIVDTAHRYGTSVTTFLAAVMLSAIMEIQQKHAAEETSKKAIQIMIPVNLRRLFPSSSVRNFSLFSLVGIGQQDENITFEELLDHIGKQLSEQITTDYIVSAIAMTARAAQFPLYRILPLPLKWLLLRLAHQFFGEGNSCISISNLGIVALPEYMRDFVNYMDFMLTPRIRSPYNCGIVTFDEKMSINFSRSSPSSELEIIFFQKLEQIIS